MEQRELGTTGIRVSPIGLGAWQLAEPSISHAALRYCLSEPAVSTVIPGAKTAAQGRDNFAAAEAKLPPEVVRAVRELWEREVKDSPLPW